MNEFLLAALVLMATLVPCLVVCLHHDPMEGLVGLELAGPATSMVLLLVAEGTHRQPFADVAIVAAVLSFAGSLAYARFLERRL